MWPLLQAPDQSPYDRSAQEFLLQRHSLRTCWPRATADHLRAIEDDIALASVVRQRPGQGCEGCDIACGNHGKRNAIGSPQGPRLSRALLAVDYLRPGGQFVPGEPGIHLLLQSDYH